MTALLTPPPTAAPPAPAGAGLMTAAEFAALPDDGRLLELIKGKVVELSRPKPRHGKVCSRIAYLIERWHEGRDAGHVMSNDTGVLLAEGPDTVVGPDVAFVSYERLPKDADLDEYMPAPELAVEVKSEHDSWPELIERAGAFLVAGSQVVVVADPFTATVRVFAADRTETLDGGETLRLPEALPGFEAPVAELFP